MALIKIDDAVRAIDDCIVGKGPGSMTLRMLCHSVLKSGIACPVIEAVPIDPLCEWLAEVAIKSDSGVEELDAEGWKRELRAWMKEQEAEHDHRP